MLTGLATTPRPQAPDRGPGLPTTTRLPSLTGFRFVAAALVVLDHSDALTGNDVFKRFSVGVSFFFVLSGFVLAWSRREGTSPRAFYRGRLARIYPLYLACLGMGLALQLASGRLPSWAELVTSLTLTQAWVPSRDVFFAINGVSWSLSCEAFFYLLLPLLVRALAPWTRGQRRALAAVLACASILFVSAFGATDSASYGYWMTYILPLARLPEFVLGMLLAWEVRDGLRPRLAPALLLAGLGLAATWALPAASTRVTAVVLIPILVLVPALAARDLAGGRPSVFATRTMVRLGEWSFALYLVHQIVYRVLTHVLPVPLQSGLGVPVVAAALCAGVAVSGALYVTVERPAERLLRGHPGTRPVPAVPPLPAPRPAPTSARS